MERQVVWETVDGVGTEHLTVTFDDGISATGVVVGVADEPFSVRYSVRCDDSPTVRSVRIDSFGDENRRELEHDGEGNWTDGDGNPIPDVSGCLDVDIAVTPFTNTIPIRRLGLESGESSVIRVAYLDVPSLTVTPVEQRYTCLEPRGEDGGRYRYESLDSGFTAELPVDSDGLVLDYPRVFRRTFP